MALQDWLCFAALWVGTALLYAQVVNFEFVLYDDYEYINEVVRQGLSPHTIAWAFTTTTFANWLPVTWLSHLLDVTLFGTHAGGHHATSALIHGLNGGLVFLVLRRLFGGARGRSLAAALLFAVHPLRVESAVWIAERKDVLCAAFFFLTLLAYERYVRRRPTAGGYLTVCAAYALGLMSKTMIVTLPALLLLLDVWPLKRRQARQGGADDDATPRPTSWGLLVLEKVPLLVMALIASAWTVVLQHSGGALGMQLTLTRSQRLANAVVSVPRYLAKIAWPTDLSIFYPHPRSWPTAVAAASVALVVLLSAGAWLVRRRLPQVAVGWFWFLGMLLPVSGIIQAGAQSMADRYTYLPAIGLGIALVWTVADAMARRPRWVLPGQVAFGIACAMLAVLTFRQQAVWENTFTLMSHANQVTRDNWLARGHIANQLIRQNDLAGAERYYAEAVAIRPAYIEGWYNLGNLMVRTGRPGEAAERYRRALELDPRHAESLLGLGTAKAMQGDFPAAEQRYREALEAKPSWADALVNLGSAVRNQGRLYEAYGYYAEALRLQPDNARARRAVEELGVRATPRPPLR